MGERQRSFLEASLPHLDAIYRLARRSTRDRESAEDLVQETYLRAFAHYEEGSVENAKAWLTTICLNLARSEARRQARRPSEMPVEDLERVRTSGEDIFDQVDAALTRGEIDAALNELPPEQKLAIVLMDLVGHSASEVAAILACPRGTVLARVHRGRRRLVALLAQRGIGRDVL
ncbi:MAG: sigma-70 family RNA polymerase sigma factor [Acidimicrobiales bacterium]